MSFLRRFLYISTCYIATIQASHAASFDCSKASTPIEKEICSNGELNELDSALGASYSKARSKAVDQPTKASLTSAQREWNKEFNDTCGKLSGGPKDNFQACIKSSLLTRIQQLSGEGSATPPASPATTQPATNFNITTPDCPSLNSINIDRLDDGSITRYFGTSLSNWKEGDFNAFSSLLVSCRMQGAAFTKYDQNYFPRLVADSVADLKKRRDNAIFAHGLQDMANNLAREVETIASSATSRLLNQQENARLVNISNEAKDLFKKHGSQEFLAVANRVDQVISNNGRFSKGNAVDIEAQRLMAEIDAIPDTVDSFKMWQAVDKKVTDLRFKYPQQNPSPSMIALLESLKQKREALSAANKRSQDKQAEIAYEKHASEISTLGIPDAFLQTKIMVRQPSGEFTAWITLGQWIGLVKDRRNVVAIEGIQNRDTYGLKIKESGEPSSGFLFRKDMGELYLAYYARPDGMAVPLNSPSTLNTATIYMLQAAGR